MWPCGVVGRMSCVEANLLTMGLRWVGSAGRWLWNTGCAGGARFAAIGELQQCGAGRRCGLKAQRGDIGGGGDAVELRANAVRCAWEIRSVGKSVSGSATIDERLELFVVPPRLGNVMVCE